MEHTIYWAQRSYGGSLEFAVTQQNDEDGFVSKTLLWVIWLALKQRDKRGVSTT
jgi:hypothetical protein